MADTALTGVRKDGEWQGLKDDVAGLRSLKDPIDLVAVGAAGNGLRQLTTGADGTTTVQQLTALPFPFAPAIWNDVVSASASTSDSPSGGHAVLMGYSNRGEVALEGSSRRADVQGTSFAAPRLTAWEAIYLLNGGRFACDTYRPPLGYT